LPLFSPNAISKNTVIVLSEIAAEKVAPELKGKGNHQALRPNNGIAFIAAIAASNSNNCVSRSGRRSRIAKGSAGKAGGNFSPVTTNGSEDLKGDREAGTRGAATTAC
jgi:hypothetical protein